MSTFDPNLFLQTQSTEANDTRLIPVPEGEFSGMIKDLTPRTTSNGSPLIDINWSLEDPAITAATGLQTATVRQTIWLDLTESGGLDFSKGKNVSLGRLREAVGQNQAGKPWSPSNLIGAVARVKVTHSFDKNDSSIVYANVGAVTKL